MYLTLFAMALFGTRLISISLADTANMSESITINHHHVSLDSSTSNSSSLLAKREHSR